MISDCHLCRHSHADAGVLRCGRTQLDVIQQHQQGCPIGRFAAGAAIVETTPEMADRQAKERRLAAQRLAICQVCDEFTVADPDGLVVGCDASRCSVKRVSLTRGRCELNRWGGASTA